VKIATWNLQWAKPGTERHQRAIDHLESLDADVIVTTEHSLFDWPRYPHRIDGGPEWGYPIVGERRKVIAVSREPWTDVRTIGTRPTQGRYVRGTTTVGNASVEVFAVCTPWSDAHVRSGHADQNRWGEQSLRDRACSGLAERHQRCPADRSLGRSGHLELRRLIRQINPRRYPTLVDPGSCGLVARSDAQSRAPNENLRWLGLEPSAGSQQFQEALRGLRPRRQGCARR